jgi:nitrogen fixation NifU-like protein
MYRQQILDHYRNPRNYGELNNPTYSHTGENATCGDSIEVDVELDDDESRVVDVRFRGDGCAISQAAASLLTEELKGMTVNKMLELDTDDVLDVLGIEVTPMRIKCAVLAEKVIQDGVKLDQENIDIESTTTE